MKLIPYGRQYIDKKDIAAVSKALTNELITTGKEVIRFEKLFSKIVGSKYSVSCSNGTTGLLSAYLALGIKRNDIIIMPSINFISSMNMAHFLGAKVYLTDVNPKTGQMQPEDLEKCIKRNNLKKINTVVVMHNGGIPSDMKRFKRLKIKYKFNLIEDACHSLGGSYSSKKDMVGSCKYSEISVFSFHPVKNITTGEGGMITTNSKKLYQNLKLIRNHGILRKKSNNKIYNWGYKIITTGFNFRITDFQAALGISQLSKLKKFITKRKAIVKRYKQNLLPNSNFEFFDTNQKTNPAYHLLIINLKLEKMKISRNEIIKKLFKEGIISQVHYIPIFLFPLYKKIYNQNEFQNALIYYNSCLSIPIYYGLSFKDVDFVSKKLKEIIK